MSDAATQHNNSIVEKLGVQEIDDAVRRIRDLAGFAIEEFSYDRISEALANPYTHGKATMMFIKEEITKEKGIEYNDTNTLDSNCTNEQAIAIAEERFNSGNKVDVYAAHKDENDTIRKGFIQLEDGSYVVDKKLLKGFIVKLVSNSTIPKAGDEKNPIYHAIPDLKDVTEILNFLLDNRHEPSDNDYTEILMKLEYFNERPECIEIMDIIAEIMMMRYGSAVIPHLQACNYTPKDYQGRIVN